MPVFHLVMYERSVSAPAGIARQVTIDLGPCRVMCMHGTVHPRLTESQTLCYPNSLSYSYCTCAVKNGGHDIRRCVHSAVLWLIHCSSVEQKRKNAALSVECKLLFFTMEIRT